MTFAIYKLTFVLRTIIVIVSAIAIRLTILNLSLILSIREGELYRFFIMFCYILMSLFWIFLFQMGLCRFKG